MSFLQKIFGNDKIVENNKKVYDQFLLNLALNQENEYLKQLTTEAGERYYTSKRKNGELTEEDRESIKKDIENRLY